MANSTMKFLITNDDGIDAPGLAALERAARRFGQCVTLAPATGHSGCGHQLTVNRPLRIAHHGPDRMALDGTPADCARIGLLPLDLEPDWVLSGINAGGNLGADMYVSGTIAAVREAALLGKPGIAFSYYRPRDVEFNWHRAEIMAELVLNELIKAPCPPRAFINVNLPHSAADAPMPSIMQCFADASPFAVSFREEAGEFHYDGDYHARPRKSGSDIDHCFNGNISVVYINLD